MSASQDQSSLNSARGAGTTFGPNSGVGKGTPGTSVGQATLAGHGQHPKDLGDDSNAVLPGSKIGPQQEDLDGEQMRAPGEGEVFRAQLDKKDQGWGEQDSLTSGLDRKKAEQQSARDEIKQERKAGGNVDGQTGGRVENEGLASAQ